MDGFERGNRNPTMKVGIIDAIVYLDYGMVEGMRANAHSQTVRNLCIAGASDPAAYSAMPGDTWLVQGRARSGDYAEPGTANNMVGVTALNGARYLDFISHVQFEQQWQWGGINLSEQMVKNPNDPANAGATNQGSASAIAGKLTMPWKSSKPGYAGDMIRWCVRVPFADSSRAGYGTPNDDYDKTPYVPGDVVDKIGASYEPFDPSDLHAQAAAAFQAMTYAKAEGGISDMSYDEVQP